MLECSAFVELLHTATADISTVLNILTCAYGPSPTQDQSPMDETLAKNVEALEQELQRFLRLHRHVLDEPL